MKKTHFASYGDDSRKCYKSLEEDSIKLFQWFSDNENNANNDKCHLLVSGKNCVTLNVNGFEIENTECEKLLGRSIAD